MNQHPLGGSRETAGSEVRPMERPESRDTQNREEVSGRCGIQKHLVSETKDQNGSKKISQKQLHHSLWAVSDNAIQSHALESMNRNGAVSVLDYSGLLLKDILALNGRDKQDWDY